MTTADKLREIITRIIKKDVEIGLDEPLNTIVISSLKFVIILGEIERIFDLEIPENQLDLDNFQTINTIINLISRVQTIQS